MVLRGSEDCSETPPGVAVADTTVAWVRPVITIIKDNNSVLNMRIGVAPFDWVCKLYLI